MTSGYRMGSINGAPEAAQGGKVGLGWDMVFFRGKPLNALQDLLVRSFLLQFLEIAFSPSRLDVAITSVTTSSSFSVTTQL